MSAARHGGRDRLGLACDRDGRRAQLPAHLDLWAQTSQVPVADPEVATWLHGSVEPSADVQVIWRAGTDVTALERQALIDRIEYLQSCRPSSLEAVTIAAQRPLAAAWFSELVKDNNGKIKPAVRSHQLRSSRLPGEADVGELMVRFPLRREARQGEVGLVIGDEYLAIRNFTED